VTRKESLSIKGNYAEVYSTIYTAFEKGWEARRGT